MIKKQNFVCYGCGKDRAGNSIGHIISVGGNSKTAKTFNAAKAAERKK